MLVTETFKQYIEGLGTSFADLRPRINQPMANLISSVHGTGLRARALEWLVTEGLQQASIGREKLLAIINQKSQGNNLKIGQRLQNILPSKKVAGIGEARQPVGYPGEDKFSNDKTITSLDLFSPEAYKLIPELNSIAIDGLSIQDYYAKHFEPKEMNIYAAPGELMHFDLEQMRKTLEAYGFKSFKYGGFDGYMQYLEKGDYLPDEKKRVYTSRNDQHGPDLRPDR